MARRLRSIACCMVLCCGTSQASVLGRDDACYRKKYDIQIEILENPSEATWMIDDMGVPVKLGCATQTWDITFCTEVCELAVGDECKPSNRNGDNRCSDELVCVETDFDTYTCQPTLDYSDYSSSSSLLDLKNLFGI